MTAAELPGDVVVLSVVRPVGGDHTEHVFRVLHGGELIGEVATIGEAAAIAEDISARSSFSG